jgi:hypothetical protein|tara:strand:+ start:183 stop:683 length:501 start_codon:yes stop_codon:yes gene_type:complete
MMKKGIAIVNLLKNIKKAKSTKKSKAKFEKTYGYKQTASVKKYNIKGGGSGSTDTSAIVPVGRQTGRGSSFRTRILGPKGQTPYQGKRLGSQGNMESWRNDMERTFNLPSFQEVSRSLFKPRGKVKKKAKGGDVGIISKVAKKLTKASAAHAGQAKALKKVISKYV